MENARTRIRYSDAFKRKVVEEVECGRYSISGALRVYDIGGNMTIQRWMRKLGKRHLVGTTVRVEMEDERNKVEALEKEKQALESALAQAQLKIIALEKTIAFLEEKSGAEVKKKSDAPSSSESSKTPGTEKDDTK
jgi:transposase-like protein